MAIKSMQLENPAGTFHRYRGPLSSRRKAFVRRSSEDHRFGLLPDYARIAFGHGHRELRKQKQ